MAPHGDDHYEPKDAIGAAGKSTLTYGSFGLAASAVQSALQKNNVGALAVFTKFGGNIVSFGAAGGIYEFSRHAAANLREKKDHWNEAIGGFCGGAVMGLRSMRMPSVIGSGALFAVVLATFDYTGGSLRGFRPDPEVDEFERKEQMRLNRRRPAEETIAELGEGGAIRPPGYEERRRQRLKEKYGVDINPVSADPDA